MTVSPAARSPRAEVPSRGASAKAVARRGAVVVRPAPRPAARSAFRAAVRRLVAVLLLGPAAALFLGGTTAVAAPAHGVPNHTPAAAANAVPEQGIWPQAPVPSPTPTPPAPPPTGGTGGGGAEYCNTLPSPQKEQCQARTSNNPLTFATDPLGAIARATAEAAVWFIEKLAIAINATTDVDFTNQGFLKQYAVVFAASAFLTLLVWMIAVTKRAVRGVPLGTAIGEAVGYLWLAVMASAFTPLALHMSVSLVDSITAAIATGTKQDTDKFLDGFSQGLDPQSLGGGPVTLIFVSMFAILAAMILWIELLVRAALLYVGAILGTVVYSGIVDRDMWGHVRRWVGMMVAILLAKPIIVIVLGLAMAASSGSDGSDKLAGVLTGLAIMFLAIFASMMVYKFIPSLGDDIASLRSGRLEMAAGTKSALTGGTASYVKAGMGVHAGRTGTAAPTAAATASTGSASSGTAGGVASGMAAHGGDSGADSGGGNQGLRSPRWLAPETSSPPPPPPASGMPHASDPPPAPRAPSPRQGD